jgi:hypothetical protein
MGWAHPVAAIVKHLTGKERCLRCSFVARTLLRLGRPWRPWRSLPCYRRTRPESPTVTNRRAGIAAIPLLRAVSSGRPDPDSPSIQGSFRLSGVSGNWTGRTNSPGGKRNA